MNQLFEKLLTQLQEVNSNLDLEKYKYTLELHEKFALLKTSIETELSQFIPYILNKRQELLKEKNAELTEELIKENFFVISQKDVEDYNKLLNEQKQKQDGEKAN